MADLVKHHVLTLKEVIDAQATGDQAQAWKSARTAAGHMGKVADPLAAAIAKQFPQRFASNCGGTEPHQIRSQRRGVRS